MGTTSKPPEVEETEETKEKSEQQLAAEAGDKEIPEQRPAGFEGVDKVSDASVRIDNNEPATQDDFDRANSDEQKQAAAESSRTPILIVGQRVTIIDGPEVGRMGYVLSINYVDALNAMLANSPHSERRFAEVESYVVRTRDGRSDTLSLKPSEIRPLDDIEGWGRGQI